MKKLLVCLAVVLFAQWVGGCGIFGVPKTIDGSQATYDAHPEWTTPPSYMNPDNNYNVDDK